MKLTIDDVRSRFIKHFDGTTGSVYASPGRINLIGEHTDYNNGYVFPGAVEQGIIAEIKPNGTRNVRAYSIDLKDYTEFSLDDEKGPSASWARYIYGVCREMMALDVPVQGFNTAFAGDVPLGAGMSSSAALESTFAFALNDLFGDNKIEKMELARVGQRTEHKYVGVNCGIMDQAISVLGKKGSLLRLDCRSGEYEYFPWNPKGYQLVLVNSQVKHTLAGSPYNERRLACERTASVIAKKHPVVATYVAAASAPIINTGLFILGCFVGLNTIKEVFGLDDSTAAIAFVFVGIVGFNFFIELGINILLSPAVVKIIEVVQGKIREKKQIVEDSEEDEPQQPEEPIEETLEENIENPGD